MNTLCPPFLRPAQSDLASLVAGRCPVRSTPADFSILAPLQSRPQGHGTNVPRNPGPFLHLTHGGWFPSDSCQKYFPQGSLPQLGPTL